MEITNPGLVSAVSKLQKSATNKKTSGREWKRRTAALLADNQQLSLYAKSLLEGMATIHEIAKENQSLLRLIIAPEAKKGLKEIFNISGTFFMNPPKEEKDDADSSENGPEEGDPVPADGRPDGEDSPEREDGG